MEDSLPVLGVGASLSFGAPPDPVALARQPGGPDFVEYAGAVQHEPMMPFVRQLQQVGVPVLYHPSCLNLCGPWPNPPAWLAAVDAHVRAVGSAWLAQDVAVCFVGAQPGYSIQLGYFVPPVMTRESLDEAVARVSEVRAAVAAPLLLEPPPVTWKLGEMDIFAWLGELAERTDCGLLLDCGHVLSHQCLAGQADPAWGLDKLPLERVIEVHIAGGFLEERGGRRYYQDAHELPILPEAWAIYEALLRRCPNLKAICVECEGASAEAVLPTLARARQRAVIGAINPDLRAKARGARA